ncbi:MAG: hypothetical protein ACR2NU_06945 [Aeoliella sp.]
MIYFLTTRKHRYTMDVCLRTDGKQLTSRVQMMSYGHLFLQKRLPVGVYIFADNERLDDKDRERAAFVWDQLDADGRSRLLNHPTRVLKRYPLLRKLHDLGINQFNVHRLTDCEVPERFPVFIRGENDHRGARTDLIQNRSELDDALAEIDRTWKARTGKIFTEFCDVSDGDGVYRKYSCFRIGKKILPRHLFFRNEWEVKGWERLDPHLLEEEREFYRKNPHADELRKIFDLAGIDFGRIDYGLAEGKIQVWEINTNPLLPVPHGGGGPARQPLHDAFNQKFISVFEELDESVVVDGESVELHRPAIDWWNVGRIPAEIIYRRFSRGSRSSRQGDDSALQVA